MPDPVKKHSVPSLTLDASLYARLQSIKSESGLPIAAQLNQAVAAWLAARDATVRKPSGYIDLDTGKVVQAHPKVPFLNVERLGAGPRGRLDKKA
jgi:hypothetical protein